MGKPFFAISFLSILSFTGSVASYAQSPELDQLLQIGVPDTAPTLAVPMGVVNLANGGLHIEIPLKTIPQRGTMPPVTIKYVYDSKFWSYFSNGYQAYWLSSDQVGVPGQWRVVASPGGGQVKSQETYVPDSNSTCNPTGYSTLPAWSKFTYTDDSGNTHIFEFSFQQISPCDGPSAATSWGMYPDDSSGYYMYVITDEWGAPANIRVWDPHGNLLYNGDNSGNDISVVDTNGNALPYHFDYNGYSFSNTTYYVNTNFTNMSRTQQANYGVYDYSGELVGPSSLTLPDGRTYSFSYDQCPGTSPCNATDYHYGMLTKMTLPTGTTLTFNYQNLDTATEYDVGDFRIVSVSMSGESLGNCAASNSWSGRTWSLCYHLTSAPANPQETWTNEVDVTLPADSNSVKNQIVYEGGGSFAGTGPPAFLAGEKTLYQGLAQGGNIIRQDTYSYSRGGLDLVGQISDVATMLDDHTSTHVSYSYWALGLGPMVSSKKEYDTSGQLARETDMTYVSAGQAWGSTIFPHYIDRPLSATIYGPGGSSSAPLAQKIFSYDGSALSTTSGTSNHSILGQSSHDDASFGSSMLSRGNLTSIQEMVSPGQYLTTLTNVYNIFGQIISATDVKEHTTNYDYYSSSWGDGSCASSTTFNYQTSVTNTLGQSTKNVYNSCDGTIYRIQTQNDINANRNGTVYTYDTSERVRQVAYPDGGSVTTDYGGSGVPEIITTSVATGSSIPLVSTTQLDGLGRTIRTIDPSGAIVDLAYDNLGNTLYATNPYYSTNESTYGVTSYKYDPLNRPILQCQPDNGTGTGPCVAQNSYKSWVYSGRTTAATDEIGHASVQATDVLGNLAKVIEPGSLTTTYQYDPLNDLICVDQWGAGTVGSACGSSHTRSFSYDSLSRLLAASNPESGAITYSYLNGGLPCSGSISLPCSKTDARSITVNYGYDALNRIVSKTYSGQGTAAQAIASITPSSCYQYDATASDPSSANMVGLLHHAWTQTGACPTTVPSASLLTRHSVIAYDPMGRVTSEQQCAPSTSGSIGGCTSSSPSPFALTYHYDLAGHLDQYTNGISSIIFTPQYDGAGRLSTLTSSWVDATHPAILFTAPPNNGYSPSGVVQNFLLGNSINVTKSFNNRLWSTGETAIHP